ncbi:hypothetical protein [Nocardiopsis rhodophaea]|uniref:hypothetical protein n=1 Tax=Nocardiopsis rhodophaea TaxID=280238 RepID=UPI0031E40B56
MRRRGAGPRRYAEDVPTASGRAPRPSRIPDRDAFYELAELSPHAGRWSFTYDHEALAPYTARNQVEPQVVIAAATVSDLAIVLDSIDAPSWPRRFQITAEQQKAWAEEQAELTRVAGVGALR